MSGFDEIDPEVVDFETTVLFLLREQLVEQRRVRSWLAQIFWLQAGLLLIGVAGLAAGIIWAVTR